MSSLSFRLRQAIADVQWRARARGAGAWPARLRLVLGIGRSGTSWTAHVLAEANPQLAYLQEPLACLVPPTRLNHTPDSSAMPFSASVGPGHRLFSILSALTAYPDSPILKDSARPRGLPADPKMVLIKEVHALLGTHHLLDSKACAIALVRRPLDVLVSLADTFGHGTRYLDLEGKSVRGPAFLGFVGLSRQQITLDTSSDWANKLVTIALIQRYFHTLAVKFPNFLVVEYEALERAPQGEFKRISRHLGLTLGMPLERAVQASLSTRPASQPFTVGKNPQPAAGPELFGESAWAELESISQTFLPTLALQVAL